MSVIAIALMHKQIFLSRDVMLSAYSADGPTDGPTDRRTNGPTDQRTDIPSYRDARTHLKMPGTFINDTKKYKLCTHARKLKKTLFLGK